MSREEFDAQVEELMAGTEDPTPVDWIKAAVRVRHDCNKCGCSGTYVWGANGQFSGVCFRCEGKGYQDDADRRRNWGYDNYAPLPGFDGGFEDYSDEKAA